MDTGSLQISQTSNKRGKRLLRDSYKNACRDRSYFLFISSGFIWHTDFNSEKCKSFLKKFSKSRSSEYINLNLLLLHFSIRLFSGYLSKYIRLLWTLYTKNSTRILHIFFVLHCIVRLS